MEIGKIHCFFEQSGIFKNEFKKFGFEEFDLGIKQKRPNIQLTLF